MKVFESNILENSTAQKPEDSNKMKSELKLMLNNDNYNLTTGFLASEVLEGRNSDRYQYVPHIMILTQVCFQVLKLVHLILILMVAMN